MLRLKVNLNCSAGGVLYHFSSDFSDIVSIVDNGMAPANNYEEAPHKDGLNGKPQPFISFSRTRDNPARIGYINQGEGGGVVYSKDALSNLGKFEAFHHGGDNHEGNEIRVLIPNPSAAGVDTAKRQVIQFDFTNSSGKRVDGKPYYLYVLEAGIPIGNGSITKRHLSIEDKQAGEGMQDWIERNKANLLDYTSELGYENHPEYHFGIEMSIDKDLNKLPELLQEAVKKTLSAIDEYRKANPGEPGYFYIKAPFLNSPALDNGHPWVKMQNSPQFDYEDLLDIIKKTEKLEEEGDPIADVSYQDATHQQIIATVPTRLFGKSFQDLPPTLRTILSFGKWNETEDRLWLNPRFVKGSPGSYKPIPETRKAVIGIIVPDSTYFNPEVNEFRKTHPNIPVYAYTENREKKAPGVPPEAYKNPVA